MAHSAMRTANLGDLGNQLVGSWLLQSAFYHWLSLVSKTQTPEPIMAHHLLKTLRISDSWFWVHGVVDQIC